MKATQMNVFSSTQDKSLLFGELLFLSKKLVLLSQPHTENVKINSKKQKGHNKEPREELLKTKSG